MKSIVKAAAGALLAGGLSVMSAAPANAAVHVGIGFPAPVVYPAAYYPPPCYAYGPYACPRSVYYGPAYRYWGPAWYGWHRGPHFRRW
jgi:hypothetical protein